VVSASWDLFFGDLFLAIPVVGDVVVPGCLIAVAVSSSESAVVVGGMSAIGGALYRIEIFKGSAFRYKIDIFYNDFPVFRHGSADETTRAKDILATVSPLWIDRHDHT
jgi:hypothetical protein